MSCRIALAAVRYFKPTFHRPPTYEKKGALLEPQARARLAQQTAEDYQNKFIPFLNDLARAFHFQVVIFWQPTLFTESVRIGEENLLGNVEPFSADTNAADLYREAYRLIHTDAGQNVYNISDALEGRKKECYADSAHLSEECNLTVATRMVEILRARYLNDVH